MTARIRKRSRFNIRSAVLFCGLLLASPMGCATSGIKQPEKPKNTEQKIMELCNSGKGNFHRVFLDGNRISVEGRRMQENKILVPEFENICSEKDECKGTQAQRRIVYVGKTPVICPKNGKKGGFGSHSLVEYGH
jgi:hypothetical protein